MVFWDITTGILIAFMIIGGVIYGIRTNERPVLIVSTIALAAIVLWRSSCWYHGLKCDAVTGHETETPSIESLVFGGGGH